MSGPEEIRRSAREAADSLERAISDPQGAARAVAESCEEAWNRHTMQDRVCTLVRDLGYKCLQEPLRRFEHIRRESIRRCRQLVGPVEEALSRLATSRQR